MEIRYTLTVDDYIDANRVRSMNGTLGRRLNHYIFLKFAYVVGALVVFGGIANLYLSRHLSSTGIFLFAFGGYCLFSRSFYRDRAHSFVEGAKLRYERAARIDDRGIVIIRTNGTSETRMAWAYYDGFAEGAGVFVLFPDQHHLLILPKRQMSEVDQEELRGLMGRQIAGHVVR